MNPWPYVIAAYAITFAGTLGLSIVSMVAMKRAERRADAVSKRS